MSKWRVIFHQNAEKQLGKFDKVSKQKIWQFFEKISQEQNPKNKALQMRGNMKEFYRFRIGDYRAICKFENETLIILVLKIGHRKKIYLNH